MDEELVRDELDQIYLDSDNKMDLNYWAPLSRIIAESIQVRGQLGITQYDIAQKMKTTQSSISRFENLGRVPNYDFIARLSDSLGHAPGMTIFGDYMAVVPFDDQFFIKKMADSDQKSTRRFVQDLLEDAIQKMKIRSFIEIDANQDRNLPFVKKNEFGFYISESLAKPTTPCERGSNDYGCAA
jgi:transcriptional regulator with XRE-family HTH domain